MTVISRDGVYIEHMLECIQKIEQYTESDRNRFLKDMMLQDAVLRVLQVMAESSQHLSNDAKKCRPEIDWRAISGFRNILVHDYLGGVDLELIWQVIESELPQLKKALLKMK
jgi:uncharacterized protein with HEPN domain